MTMKTTAPKPLRVRPGAGVEHPPSPPAPVHPVLQLQRTLGNRAVRRLLASAKQVPLTLDRKTDKVAGEKQVEACMTQKDDILPGIGLVAAIARDQELQDTLGPELAPLTARIRASAEARRFVCEAGVPAMLALWDTQVPAGALDVPAATNALANDKTRVYSDNLDSGWLRRRRLVHAQTEMLDVASMTEHETKSMGLPELLLPALSPPRIGSEQHAAKELDALAPVFELATKQFAAADVTAGKVRDRLGDARKEMAQAVSNPDFGDPRKPLETAAMEAADLSKELSLVNPGIDASDLVSNSAALSANVTGLSPASTSANLDALTKVLDAAKQLQKRVADAAAQAPDLSGAARRVSFVLRYFAALNSPGFAGAPGKDEAKAMLGKLNDLEPDLKSLFGPGSELAMAFFIDLAKKLDLQIGTRSDMETALGHDTELVPPQTDVLSYFHSMAKKSNAVVIPAYVKYAQAFFEHRIVATMEEFQVSGLEEIYARPLSLAGARPLVCTGYAVLGSKVLGQAGASTKEFIVGIHASDDNLRSGNFDEGHAIAVVQRSGATLYVSNHLVVDNRNDAIGPNAVAWDHPNLPLITGQGASVPAAIASLEQELVRRRQRLSRP